MEKRWVIKQAGDKEKVRELSRVLNISTQLANLLYQRDITTFAEAKAFFRPELSNLHEPFLMKDMELAIERIETAIRNHEKIMIYGDYDVDGTTAVALVYSFFKNIYSNLDFYIPDRYSEGYGISYKSIDYAVENGYSLVIALDCGIKAVDKMEYATSHHIDFIIADHHRPASQLPKAFAVLDAQRPDCHYPYKELSGCGVGFKLIQAYAQKNNIPFNLIMPYLDLVAISIASDIVPITGENRILAYYGLKLINSNPRPGVEAILKYSGLNRRKENYQNTKQQAFKRELNINDMVFLIGPRINAAGRMKSGKDSVRLLIAENIEKADELANEINEFNNERKNLDNQITQQALEMIRDQEEDKGYKSTVVYNPNWHKGVIGIVASRLIEHYYRPTVVLTKSNGLITGSARSVKDFDVYDAIDACSDLLENFGGHKYAAGLSLDPGNLEAFRKRFEDVVSQTIEDHMLVPEIEIDAEIKLSDISGKFFRILKQFAPFGPGNMAPVFKTNGIVDTGYGRIVGKNHLKLNVVHPDISTLPFSAIAFQQGDHLSKVTRGQRFSICYHLEENQWNGSTTLQLRIKDMKLEPVHTDEEEEEITSPLERGQSE
ncbi:MAG: single-stranded-DNA-specific exonuclease RecJ [Bacteroidales bacterium]|nr:single-stranded-DNA-specific exonuclease RecJ [Bacteroidales bacterium]